MAKIPDFKQHSLTYKVHLRSRERWPTLADVDARLRGHFAYLDGALPNGEVLNLCRLRNGGSASRWGFAIYRASHDNYEDSYLPNEHSAGSSEDARDTACGLSLGDPTAWT